jgi:hypothetical protein
MIVAPAGPPIPPPIIPQQLELWDAVQSAALNCLKELSLSLSCTVCLMFFATVPHGLTLIASALVVQLAVSLIFHTLGAFASSKILENGDSRILYERLLSCCEWIIGINFALFTGYNTQTLIHESGHALASLLLYKHPSPLIEIYPFSRAITEYCKTGLSFLGKQIGPAAATCFIVMSGPLLTLLVSSTLLTIGMAIKEKHPQFGKYLISWALLDFLNHSIYAYDAIHAKPWNLSHDFVHLSVFGLDPVTAAVGIAAVPVLIGFGMYIGLNSD